MSISILNADVLKMIFLELDIPSLIWMSGINNSFNIFCQQELLYLLRIKLKIMTKFYTDNYTLEQLYNIYRLQYTGISAGYNHSLLLNTKGEVYSLDSGWDKTRLFESFMPEIISSLSNVSNILAGCSSSSFMIKDDGKLYVLGSNVFLNLGLKDIDVVHIPTLISNLSPIRYISTCHTRTFLISDSNEVYSCGLNMLGDLGLTGDHNRQEFEIIPDISNAIDVAVNTCYSFILINSKTLLCLGKHIKRLIHFTEDIIKISAKSMHIGALSSKGKIYWCRAYSHTKDFILLKELSNIIDISLGSYYMLALDNKGIVYDWSGCGVTANLCTLNDFTDAHSKDPVNHPIAILPLSNIIKISAGYNHVLVLDYNGNIYSFGVNHLSLSVISQYKSFLNPIRIPNINLL